MTKETFYYVDSEGNDATYEYEHDFVNNDVIYNRQFLYKYGAVAHVWSWQDVIQKWLDDYDDLDNVPKPDDVRQILDVIYDGLDSNFGITWDSIDEGLTTYKNNLEKRKQND